LLELFSGGARTLRVDNSGFLGMMYTYNVHIYILSLVFKSMPDQAWIIQYGLQLSIQLVLVIGNQILASAGKPAMLFIGST